MEDRIFPLMELEKELVEEALRHGLTSLLVLKSLLISSFECAQIGLCFEFVMFELMICFVSYDASGNKKFQVLWL